MLARALATAALAALSLSPVSLSAQTNVRGSGQAHYHLMQLSVSAQDMALEDFEAKTRTISSCADAKGLARELGADIRRNRYVMAHRLPDQVKIALQSTDIGNATQVFSDDDETMRVLVVCNIA